MALILPRNWCLLFFRDPRAEFTPERMTDVLRDVGLTVAGQREPFTVNCGMGPTMSVSIQRGTQIEAVIRGLVGNRRQYCEYIPGRDVQIKIELNDMDKALDDINTLIQIDAARLQEATSGLMYLSWNQQFTAPNDSGLLPSFPQLQPFNKSTRQRRTDPTNPPKKVFDAAADEKWLTGKQTGPMFVMLSGQFFGQKNSSLRLRMPPGSIP